MRAEARGGLTAAAAYLRKKGKHLDPLVQRYIEACAPLVIPPDRKGPILELRKWIRNLQLPLAPDALGEWDIELFEVYHDIADALLNPELPELRNTDDEPLSFHKLVFEIESPRAAFDALKALALDADEAALLAGAEMDEHGELRRVEFPWQKRGNTKNKSWDNTILGNLALDGARLVAEVNSEARAKRIREIIEDRLGARARHLATEIQSTESMLARAREEGDNAAARARKEEHERFASQPEVQAMLTEQLRRYYESWTEEKIPALGGKTPRQAVKDPEGREMVEALFLQIERGGCAMSPPLDESIPRELRARLRLPKK